MSLSTQKAALYARLCADTDAGLPVASLTRVSRVFDHEPLSRPNGVSIAIQTAGWDPWNWFFAIKVYIDITQGAEKLQHDQDVTIGEVEALLDLDGTTQKADGSVKYEPELGALIASFNVKMPRDDLH